MSFTAAWVRVNWRSVIFRNGQNGDLNNHSRIKFRFWICSRKGCAMTWSKATPSPPAWSHCCHRMTANAPMMLPPDTVDRTSTRFSQPNSASRFSTPKWKIDARNPPPDSAKAILGLTVSGWPSSAVIVGGRSTAAHSVFLPAAEAFIRPHWESAVGQAFPALQPYGRLALLIQSRSFNSVVAFFITSKSLQLMEPLGEISPVPL